MRVKQFYEVELMGITKELTPEEFLELQAECREIAEYPVPGTLENFIPTPTPTRTLIGKSPDGEPHRFQIEPVKRTILDGYVKLHEDGASKDEIWAKMEADGVADRKTAWCEVLRKSTRVIKLEGPKGEMTEEHTEELKAEDEKKAPERAKPKLAKGGRRRRDLSRYERMLAGGASEEAVRSAMKASGIHEGSLSRYMARVKEAVE